MKQRFLGLFAFVFLIALAMPTYGQDDRFTIDIISPDVDNGGTITGAPGSTVTVNIQVTLTTTVAGVAGVVVPVGVSGPAVVQDVVCDSTCANNQYWEGANNIFFYSIDNVDAAFENTEGPLAGSGPQGGGMIVGLTTNIITGFVYPEGTFTVLDFPIEVTIPEGDDPVAIDLTTKDGLKGVGVPQSLTVTFQSTSQSANVNGLSFNAVKQPPDLRLSMNAADAIEGEDGLPLLEIPARPGVAGTGTLFVMLNSALDQDEGIAGFQASLSYTNAVDVDSVCVADQVFEINPSLGGQKCPQSLQWTDENNAVDPDFLFELDDPECELELGAPQGKGISGGAILSGIPPGAGEFLPGNTEGPIQLLKIDVRQSSPFAEDGDETEQVGSFSWLNCLKGLGVAAKTKLTVKGQSLDPLSATGMSVRFVKVVQSDFIRGDANADGICDLSDVLHIIDYQFLGGEAPGCPDAADANDDEKINIADPVTIITSKFRNGPPLLPEVCGTDDDSNSETCPPATTSCP